MTRSLTLTIALGLGACSAGVYLHAADAKPAGAGKAVAADKAAPAAAGNLLKRTDDVKSWRLEQHEQAKGTIAAGDGALAFDVTAADDTEWHVQAFQTELTLKEGASYVVTYSAKADAERSIKVQAGIDEDDWHTVGLDEEVALGKAWKAQEHTFTATDVRAGKCRFGLVLGSAKGKVWVKDVVLKPAAK
jgi:hypothetical protein